MRISDWSSDVCSSDLVVGADRVDWAALFDQTTVEPLDVVAVGALHEGVDVAATHRDSEMLLHLGAAEAIAVAPAGRRRLHLSHQQVAQQLGDLDGIDLGIGGREAAAAQAVPVARSEEHTSELQ